MSEHKHQHPAPINAQLTASTPRRANTHLMPTLLDRLRDDAPHCQLEAPGQYAPTRRQMRDIVQRDLAYLLNTTNIEDQIDRERYPAVAASSINFGVPPLAGAFMASRKWADIERIIRRAINHFEPRLIADTLIVSPLQDVDAPQALYNVLSFEVRGMVHMEPYPLEFLVQSSLDLETSEVRITRMQERLSTARSPLSE